MTAARFQAEVEDFFRRSLPAEMAAFQADVADDAMFRVVDSTPVKDEPEGGVVKGNWRMAEGAADTSVTDAADPYGGQVLAAAREITDRIRAAGQPVDRLVISNSHPAAESLEAGSSSKAPQGMVAVAVAGLRAKYGDAVR